MAQNFDLADSEPNWENVPREGGNAHNSTFLVRETYNFLILRVGHGKGKNLYK